MKTLAYSLAAAVAIFLFTAFSSVGAVATPTVTTHVSTMYAVLPDGALVDLRASAPVEAPAARWTL